MKRFLFFLAIMLSVSAGAQSFRVSGLIANSNKEPLPLASLRVRETGKGVVSNSEGKFEIFIEKGTYHIEASMVGFRKQVHTLRLTADTVLHFELANDTSQHLSGIVVKAKIKDRAAEIMSRLVQQKDSLMAAPGAYSVQLYIKASQQEKWDSAPPKKRRFLNEGQQVPQELKGFSMAEIALALDKSAGGQIKEERLGVKTNGDTRNLFFLSATDGNFDWYQNLVKVPGLSPTPFLSPVSQQGLLAYKFKTIKTIRRGKHRIYTIKVEPRGLTNATVSGELTVSDSSWAILHTRFRLPDYHLQSFNFFEVEQEYDFVGQKAWMFTRQLFTYKTAGNRNEITGQTIVTYKDYQLGKAFAPRHFSTELSRTGSTAYEQDSAFWALARAVPLNTKEVRLIQHTDSVWKVKHSDQYLDSLERQINRITWQKIGIFGQSFYTRKKEQYWHLPSLLSLYQPVAFGGSRINVSFAYRQTFKNRKDVSLDQNISYGIRNNDINGFFKIRRLYNPFSRGYFEITAGRAFQPIFEGDAWINMISRGNVFLNNYLQAAHGIELVNGLHVSAEMETAFRRSVAGYKTGKLVDSVLRNTLNNNQAIAFEPYNALYGKLRVQYTPFQQYRREPKEKVILGSKWPTFYVQYRKGIPGLMNSKVDFDYLEYGVEQDLNLGLMGIARYTLRSGSFLRKPELRLIDYQFQRRGDPFIFLNPHRSFQLMDSTFPVFKRFLEGHYVHEFNGLFLNKIPLLKKLQLREIGGAGFLLAPERNLRYGELFAGIERAFQSPFNPLDKFKLGIYVVGSAANRFQNPVQFKIGFTSWDKRRSRWF